MKLPAGPQVIAALRLCYQAGKSVLLEGGHGIGKSQLVEQAADELGIECIVRDLSLMEPPDLVGLPCQRDGKTAYAPPSFLPDSGRGLLVFEELNRCERYMLSPCLQLLTARTLNDYELPAGWLPVAAINPSDGGYDTNELDPALLSRFSRVEVEPDVQQWLKWAAANGVHRAVMRHVESVPDVFDPDRSNPRAWTYVSDVLRSHEDGHGTADSTLLAVVAGLVGDTHARAFLETYTKAEVPLTADQVLNGYGPLRETVRRWTEQSRTDLLQSSCHKISVALQHSDTCAQLACSTAQQKALTQFLSDIPADLARGIRDLLSEQDVSLGRHRT